MNFATVIAVPGSKTEETARSYWTERMTTLAAFDLELARLPSAESAELLRGRLYALRGMNPLTSLMQGFKRYSSKRDGESFRPDRNKPIGRAILARWEKLPVLPDEETFSRKLTGRNLPFLEGNFGTKMRSWSVGVAMIGEGNDALFVLDIPLTGGGVNAVPGVFIPGRLEPMLKAFLDSDVTARKLMLPAFEGEVPLEIYRRLDASTRIEVTDE